ncbi:MAG: T9SS type A sorting domain-containing protein [Bacteroidetes bacterium]|nr:T9SS type A sorting domain-containing protein [Bacteroidota bacterium]
MQNSRTFLVVVILLLSFHLQAQSVRVSPNITPAGKGKVNTAIDNMGYWQRMVRLGYVRPNAAMPVPPPVFTGSMIRAKGIRVQDSPDRCVTGAESTTQSENSLFINPENEDELLNSNNSTDWDGTYAYVLFGVNDRYSEDGGNGWAGEIEAAGNINQGDPSVVIGRNGWWYAGKINNDFGQSVAYSTDQGKTWHDVIVSSVPFPGSDVLDKNHLWIDNSSTSPFQGRLYDGWTNFVNSSGNLRQIEISRSEDQGMTWSSPINISAGVTSGYMCQGINLQTGPNGELYGAFIIYDAWPADESAIGFAKSLNGGSVFTPATRIISNIKGIRTSLTSKNMRVNSYPSMTVDNSNGPNKGNIYLVWANIGYPGINAGSDINVYFMRSTDQGSTWMAPIRVNQDAAGLGKQHFLPWISCDPVTGNLCVIYYDDRNVGSSACETWISYSYNAGDTWTDMKVSDVSFTPVPIAGLAYDYFGDYLGVASRDMMAYPIWTDNRTGAALTYVSPVNLGPAPGQPYVIYDSYSLNSIQKNLLQNMNYGDSLYLNLGLKNVGDQPAVNVTAYLSTDSPYITITDSIENYGDFAAGEVRSVQHGYSFRVSDTIPDGLRVKFYVRAVTADTAWYSNFRIEAHAPGLTISRIMIRDSVYGNDNGRFDPGESADVLATVANSGDFLCPGAWIRISSPSDYLNFTIDSVFLDTLLPLHNKVVTFKLDVASDACQHAAANLDFLARSGLYSARKHVTETIGVIMEDWESGNFTTFPWVTGGNAQWFIDTVHYEGTYSARSGEISDMEASWLQVGYLCGADDSISFYRKVSSEPGYDYLRFYIDGILQGQWSGEEDWKRIAYPVAAGTHTFKWIYSTDVFQLLGSNAAWLDNIAFPPPPLPVVNAGNDTSVCAAQPIQLHGTVSASDSLRWTTFGDGLFSDETIPDPVYTPGPGDLSAGAVNLRLKAWGVNGCSASGMTLTIVSKPVVHITVLPNDTLCGDMTAHLTADPVQGGSYLWTPGGFTTPDILVDTSITGGLGSYWFRLRITTLNNCSSSDSARITFRDCTGIPVMEEAIQCEVFPNPNNGTFTLKITSRTHCHLDMRLQNPLGLLILEEKNIDVAGTFIKNFELGQLPPGIYILSLQNGKDRENMKIVVR